MGHCHFLVFLCQHVYCSQPVYGNSDLHTDRVCKSCMQATSFSDRNECIKILVSTYSGAISSVASKTFVKRVILEPSFSQSLSLNSRLSLALADLLQFGHSVFGVTGSGGVREYGRISQTSEGNFAHFWSQMHLSS